MVCIKPNPLVFGFVAVFTGGQYELIIGVPMRTCMLRFGDGKSTYFGSNLRNVNRLFCRAITGVMTDLCLGYGQFDWNTEIQHIGTKPVGVTVLF